MPWIRRRRLLAISLPKIAGIKDLVRFKRVGRSCCSVSACLVQLQLMCISNLPPGEQLCFGPIFWCRKGLGLVRVI